MPNRNKYASHNEGLPGENRASCFQVQMLPGHQASDEGAFIEGNKADDGREVRVVAGDRSREEDGGWVVFVVVGGGEEFREFGVDGEVECGGGMHKEW